MAKIKKKKLRVIPLTIFLFILLGIFLLIFSIIEIPIKNIIIKGTTYLNDDYILDMTNLKSYPSFIRFNKSILEKNLKDSIYIKDATIKRSFYHVVTIDIEENIPLFIYKANNSIVFSDFRESNIDNNIINFSLPIVTNVIPQSKYKKFTKAISKTNSAVLTNISEIVYSPVKLDEDRFLLYMNDGNEVYLTLTKWEKINYYDKILEQLENKHGILYLDSGNHFEIKE